MRRTIIRYNIPMSKRLGVLLIALSLFLGACNLCSGEGGNGGGYCGSPIDNGVGDESKGGTSGTKMSGASFVFYSDWLEIGACETGMCASVAQWRLDKNGVVTKRTLEMVGSEKVILQLELGEVLVLKDEITSFIGSLNSGGGIDAEPVSTCVGGRTELVKLLRENKEPAEILVDHIGVDCVAAPNEKATPQGALKAHLRELLDRALNQSN